MSDIFDDIADGVASGALAASTQQADPLFDQIGADLAKADDARNNLSIKAAMASKPEVYTDHKVLAETFGVNLDFVKRNADKLKPIALQTEMSQFLKTQPKLSGWYTQGDNPAAIKFDELRHLGGLSWLWNSAGDAFASGNQDVDLSNLRYKQLMRTATDDEISLADQMSAGREPRTFGADGWLEKGWVGMAQMLPSTISTLAGGVAGGVEGAVYGGTASLIAGQLGPQVALPEELLTVPGGAAVGYRVGSLAGQIKSTFKLEAGLAYDEFKNLRDESGAVMDDDVARAAAVVAGSANALLETVSFRKAMSTIPGADAIAGTLTKDAIKAALARPTIRAALKAFAKNTLEVGATEVTTEVMQEAITLFAGEAAKGYDGDFQMATGEDVASRLGDTFTQTLQAMTIMGPLLSGSRLGHDVGRARASARDQGIIQALNDHAAGNELNARLPEKSKEAIRTLTQGGPVTHVYVDPTAITTYFQTAEEASRFAAQAGIADEFNEAVRLGRDVEIPIESYYVNMAGTEIGEALKPYTKMSPESMYAGEAEAFNDAWQSAQESLRAEYDATQANDKQALEGEEKVFEDVKNKAMDAGIVPDQAQQYAKLYSAFFRVMSERTGQDAGELYARYGVDIKRAIPGGEASNFKPVDNLDLSLEMIRAGKIDPLRRRVEKASGPSLLQAIAARGGIIDTGGELKSIGADKVKGIVRAGEDNSGTLQMLDPTDAPVDLGAFNMYGADDTLRQMWEEGYFPEFADRPDTSVLFDAIAEEIAGRRRFSPDYSKLDDPAIQQAAGLVAFADLLDKSGLDPSTMDNDAIRSAIDAIVNADPDTGALYQPAWHGSPHIFDAFSLDAIGTGEGNQAYGWGLYFASKREVSEWYRDQLTLNSGFLVDGSDTPMTRDQASAAIAEAFPKSDDGSTRFLDNVSGVRGVADVVMDDLVYGRRTRTYPEGSERAAAYEAIHKRIKKAKSGRLYKVEVPDDAELLDWDLPLNQQTPAIKAALATLGFKEKPLPKIADAEVGLLVRQALRETDGDPRGLSVIIDNDQAMYHRAVRLMRRAGLSIDEDTTPGEFVVAQAKAHLDTMKENRIDGSAMYVELSSRLGEDVETSGNGWGNTGNVGDTKGRVPDPKAASEALRAAGIPGHRYEGHESASTNYVIYDDSRVKVEEFFQTAGVDGAAVDALQADIAERHGLRDLSLFLTKQGDLKLNMIAVDKDKQGQGSGSAAMQEIANFADANGLRVILTTGQKDDGFGTTSGSRLKKFYKRFGFVENKGRAKDFSVSENMIRDPAMYQQEGVQSGDAKGVKRGSIQLAPGRTIINLFDQADLSTFLHESGHFFLEVFKDLSTMENAPAELMTDWAITKEYLGITDDNAIGTEAHEKWARSFEAYLFEGKTPSVELAGIFARFRSWLMFVYKSVKALNAPMNAKITGVMDRLLASDEEIKSAMTGPEFHPQFADQATAGMTDAQWKDYTEVAGRAVERARRELDAKLLSEISRETTREWREAKKEIREGVAKSMSAAPVYRVISYLRGGVDEFIPGERVYLDRKAIVDLMGEGALLKLPKGVPPIYRNNGGQHPDVLAEMFGFKSGHDMLTQMMSVPPLGRAIAAETDARMRARYGDLMADSVARARAANEAIANDATGDLLAAELEVLVRKGLVTTKATKAGAKALARQLVRAKSLREAIRVKLYMNANAKAAAEAEAAILKGDWKTAVAAKQRQLLNHYMAMEARQAEKDAESAVNYLNRFAGRKRPKGVRADELDQIDALLERFDLRKSITLKDSARRAKLAAWIAEQEAAGELPAIPDTVRDDAFRKPYRDLTVDDLMALRDSVKSIEHIGRRWAAVLGDIEAREWRGKIAEGVASIARSQELKPVRKDRNPTSWDKTVSTAKSLESTLLKLEQVFDWMDNGDIHGPMHKYVWQPIADAEARENDMRLEYSARLAKIIGDLDQARLNERITVPGVQTMSRADIMAVALNTGSESNLDKMMRGEGWDKTPAVLTNLLANLNADEARAVQAIWDTVNSFWPQIEALQKKLSGVAPPKIPARESEIAGVKLSGGYYPMMYDPERSHDVEDRAAANADRMFENTYLRPETHNGFTKERKQAYARPVLFSLDGAARHITAVIHDLTHREAILDANKFLTDASVRTEIETRYGREVYQQVVPWLQSIAHDAYKNDGLAAVERFFRGVRTRASIMGMGFRIPTMLAQLAGLSSSAEMVPIKALAGAIKDFTMSPRQMWNDANRLSGEMRFRSANMDRDVRDGVNTLGHSVTDQARRFAFYGIGFMDRIVTVPTWTAAYRDFLTREPGDEAGAVAHADKVIRLTQGAGGPKDLAAITRRNELTKLVTMFYSYFSAYYNRQRAWGRDARRAWKSGDVGEVPALVARQVFMTVMPALLGELLVGRGPDDDEGYAEWAAKRVALYPVSAVPVVRDGFNVLANGFGYSFTPAARAIDEVLIQPFKMIGDIAQGDVDPRKVVKQTIETVGYSMALPLGQLATTVDNVWKAIEDDDFQLRDIVLTRPKN